MKSIMIIYKNTSAIFLILLLSIVLFSSCAKVAASKDTKTLFYENREIIKQYEKNKNKIDDPQIDKDVGYCPMCEL